MALLFKKKIKSAASLNKAIGSKLVIMSVLEFIYSSTPVPPEDPGVC